MATEWPGAARAAERVELVDEDDRRRLAARLLEEIAYPRRAHADEHLDELRARDGEESDTGFARHRAREERLAGAGRPDEQDALRDARAEAAVFLRVLQEFDDLLQLLL